MASLPNPRALFRRCTTALPSWSLEQASKELTPKGNTENSEMEHHPGKTCKKNSVAAITSTLNAFHKPTSLYFRAVNSGGAEGAVAPARKTKCFFFLT